MGGSLRRARQQIAKKRRCRVEALHEKSRDSRRIQRAILRDDKMDKIAAARRKTEQPRIERATFFQQAVRDNGLRPLAPEAIKATINRYVHQYDEEYKSVKKARRPGRPPSTRQYILEVKISELKQEYQKGFFLPDLTDEENVKKLDRWECSWSYLSNLSWVKVSEDGTVKPCPWSYDK